MRGAKVSASMTQDVEVAGEALRVIEQERARLEALDRFDVLDTPREEAFDRITRLAKKLFGVPVAIVSFIDGHRQWYKSCQGLTGAEAPREHTFCRHVIDDGQPLVVADATKDPRFAQNPYVLTDPGIRFYAGVPLRTGDGHNIGSLCLVDSKPRDFSDDELDLLVDLAHMAMDELELRLSATKDSLTGALSRRTFKEEVGRATALAIRHHQDLTCIALDLDHFKSINDSFGHAAGDLVLARSVQSLLEQIRETDLLGRIGGEEFAVLLPNTGMEGAMMAAEKMRSALERLNIEFGLQTIRVTASFGVASLDQNTRDVEALLGHADKALYEAKATGRNRCVPWRHPPSEPTTQRRRVLKGGQILFNARTSSMDCTVRSLSEDGAGLDVSSSLGVPRVFDLSIKADHLERSCRIVSQSEKHIEVAFC